MTISLAGTGVAQGQLAVTPTSTDFGSVTVGTSKTQVGTLSSSGSSVSVSSATLTNAEFSLSGITFPLTIAASVPFTLTFTPQMAGSTSAIGSFTSNASNSAAETLTGTGAAPPQHSVDLSWNETSTVAITSEPLYSGHNKEVIHDCTWRVLLPR